MERVGETDFADASIREVISTYSIQELRRLETTPDLVEELVDRAFELPVALHSLDRKSNNPHSATARIIVNVPSSNTAVKSTEAQRQWNAFYLGLTRFTQLLEGVGRGSDEVRYKNGNVINLGNFKKHFYEYVYADQSSGGGNSTELDIYKSSFSKFEVNRSEFGVELGACHASRIARFIYPKAVERYSDPQAA